MQVRRWGQIDAARVSLTTTDVGEVRNFFFFYKDYLLMKV